MISGKVESDTLHGDRDESSHFTHTHTHTHTDTQIKSWRGQ